ncbi:PPK2 family polyphosphate kinase [Roseomonas elaeocarpi]|uniref:PPK2 family polyphosphate kinase n=1 Tax=Roseomonas elaeocarpi TaxID=907779 RepID=A0ABV6JTM6_9PROT
MSIPNELQDFLRRCCVGDGDTFRLDTHETDARPDGLNKREGEALLPELVAEAAELQKRLNAKAQWGVLCIFQAMDAGGKDGTISHVFSGLNPQGTQVTSFAAPSATERRHDFLWRHVVNLPPRGMIGVHNRSWYEEVLVARVHPEVLAAQNLPPELTGEAIWKHRLHDIAGFERYLTHQGIVVLKFFLHLSAAEQRQRFLARIDEPDKNWKLQPSDIVDRKRWDDYQQAYDSAIRATASEEVPWFVIPADRKWLARLVVAAALVEKLRGLNLDYPEVSEEQRANLQRMRHELASS